MLKALAFALLIISVFWLIYVIYNTYNNNIDSFEIKPSKTEAIKIASTVFKNKDKLSSYTSAKENFDWIDPIIYEDIRMLAVNNKFDEVNISNTLI